MTDTPTAPLEPEPVPAPPPASPPAAKGAGWKSWAAAGGVAAVVVVGGIALTRHHGSSSPAAVQASASQGQSATGGQRFANRGAQGTITGVRGSTLTVSATDFNGTTSTVTVSTSSSTTYTDSVKATVGDLTVGDNVIVRGTVTNSAVTATAVTEGAQIGRGAFGGGGTPPTGSDQGPPAGFTPPTNQSGQAVQPGQGGGFRGGGFTAGSIVSKDGDAFTVKAMDGTQVVVTTNASTTITVTKTISLADLKKGDTILVIGARTGDKITATSIRRGELGAGFGGRGFGRRSTTSTTTSTS